jgi:hypothetical protein
MSDAIKALLLGVDTETPATATNPLPVELSGSDVQIGTVKILGVNGVNIAAVDGLGNLAVAGNGPVQPDTAQTGSILTAGIFNSSPPTLTDGQQVALQVDDAGNLLTTASFSGTVDTAANATASAPSYSEGTSNPLSQTLTGNLRTLAVGSGPISPGTAQTGSILTAGVFNSSPPSLTNGQQVALQVDDAGNLLTTASFSGTLNSSAEATTSAPSYTDGTQNPLSQNLTGDLRTIAKIASGQTIAVTQATAASLNATVVGTGTFASQVASATAPVSTMNSASANAGVNAPMAACFDDVSPTAISENSFGFIRMSANRNQYATIRDAAGNERGVNVNSSNQLSVSIDGSTASNISTNTAEINGVAVTMGNGVSGTGVQRVTIASDSTGQIKLAAGANVVGHVIADSGSTTAVTQATAASLNATVVGTGTFATQVASATAPVSTMNSASANAGVNSPMAACFDDVTPTSITENSFGFVRMSANRNQYTTIRDAGGNERGANVNSSNQLSVSLDGSTASNISVNVAEMNGVATTMGNGVSGTGVQRVTIASDSTGQVTLAAGTNAIGKLTTNSGVNIGTVSVDSSQLSNLLSAFATISSENAQQVCLPTDQPVSNKIQSQSNGATSSRVVSASGTPSAVVLKASAGAMVEIDVFNVAAYSVFMKIYNATSPTVGSDTPVWTIPIAAGTGYSKSFRYGKWLGTGVSYGITKLQADSDTTAVAAGDLTGAIDWI